MLRREHIMLRREHIMLRREHIIKRVQRGANSKKSQLTVAT